MADFSNLKPLVISSETLAEYSFDDIPGEPSIWFAPGTDANTELHHERMRIALDRAEEKANAPKDAKAPKRTAEQTVDEIEADRELDRVVIAKCCAKRWGTAPLDVNGDAPEFSEGNCYDFFKALPNYMFDPLRGWINNPFNFVDRSKLKVLGTITEKKARSLGNA